MYVGRFFVLWYSYHYLSLTVGVTLDTVMRQLNSDNYIITQKNDLRTLIKNYISKCYMCQQLNRNLPALLEKQYRRLTNFSSESVIGIDSVGPLPVDIHGNRYILVVKDHFDRVVKFYPTIDRETENYLHCLYQSRWKRTCSWQLINCGRYYARLGKSQPRTLIITLESWTERIEW